MGKIAFVVVVFVRCVCGREEVFELELVVEAFLEGF